MAKTAHLENVRFLVHRLNDRARAKEHQRLEKRVGHQVEHRSRQRTDAERQHHITELTDGRVS